MADESAETGGTFPTGLLAGIVAFLIVGIVAGVAVGWEYGLPILLLTGIVGGVAIVYRGLAAQGSEKDPDQGGLPKLPTDAGRPLGDTAEAHDEINPHDFPADSPARKPAEAQAQSEGGTTRGNEEGGAAGDGGSEGGDRLGADEEREGARGG